MRSLFVLLALVALCNGQIIIDNCLSGNTNYLDKVLLDFNVRGVLEGLNQVRGKLMLEFAALDQPDVDYTNPVHGVGEVELKELRAINFDLMSCVTEMCRRAEVINERLRESGSAVLVQ